MAELDVEPKSSRPWWIWMLLALIVVGLIALVRSCGKEDYPPTEVVEEADSTAGIRAVTVPDWNSVNFDAAGATFEEITDTSIAVRGDDNFTIFGLGENVLFASGAKEIRSSGENQLKQISASLKKHFPGAALAVYGNTDSEGPATENKELGKERAESVRQWLVKNSDIPEDQIKIMSKGEADPVASNQTASGRLTNRRVEIVARAR